ncbi:hypothetical protein [Pseudoalteromonas sp. BSi20495]|uniref:hypothetical protein n=1 Tax=Pseudoalteromonas sp. BSi20495 TaxID=386429 RepID=UPI00023159B7|nr:hypothetical protein [Pseudoalteromonas sp. BSi20495]GAA78182.1 hypothetical protein P20495_0673 [Pseudoalteromonas sp. BSi20495]
MLPTLTKEQLKLQHDELTKILQSFGIIKIDQAINNAIIEVIVHHLKTDLVTFESKSINDLGTKQTQAGAIRGLIFLAIERPEFIFRFHSMLTLKINHAEHWLKFLDTNPKIPSIIKHRIVNFLNA